MRKFSFLLIVFFITFVTVPTAIAADPAATSHVDVLGRAYVASGPASSRISVTLPDAAGLEMVEITALDTGQTILALPIADGQEGGGGISLSAAAAPQLGLPGNGGRVRVRRAVASPQDMALLQAGKPATPRLSVPPAMLSALRQRFDAGEHILAAAAPAHDAPHDGAASGANQAVTAPLMAMQPTPTPMTPLPEKLVAQNAAAGFFVQVAALGDRVRAAMLANLLKDIATPRLSESGKITRVQIGPFNSVADAQQALAQVRARGYVDARILHIP